MLDIVNQTLLQSYMLYLGPGNEDQRRDLSKTSPSREAQS